MIFISPGSPDVVHGLLHGSRHLGDAEAGRRRHRRPGDAALGQRGHRRLRRRPKEGVGAAVDRVFQLVGEGGDRVEGEGRDLRKKKKIRG